MDALNDKIDVTTLRTNENSTENPTREDAEAAVKVLLAWAGDNPEREGLKETPKRVVKAYEELFSGYSKKPEQHLDKVFEEVGGYDELILVREIPFRSHCEHHILPFFGNVHIAYYPNKGVIGLSKLARVVDVFAKRLQTQENLTCEIGKALESSLKPIGSAVMIDAEHLCMSMRGIQKTGTSTVTTWFSGKFKGNSNEQSRFMDLVNS